MENAGRVIDSCDVGTLTDERASRENIVLNQIYCCRRMEDFALHQSNSPPPTPTLRLKPENPFPPTNSIPFPQMHFLN